MRTIPKSEALNKLRFAYAAGARHGILYWYDKNAHPGLFVSYKSFIKRALQYGASCHLYKSGTYRVDIPSDDTRVKNTRYFFRSTP